jgi:hypothetical protein
MCPCAATCGGFTELNTGAPARGTWNGMLCEAGMFQPCFAPRVVSRRDLSGWQWHNSS